MTAQECPLIWGQRALMRKLFDDHGGEQAKVLADYEQADLLGQVKRSRNVSNTSSREYAIRLWANGIHMGWLTKTSALGQPQAATQKASREPVQLFEKPLTEMGQAWRDDPMRPRPSQEAQEHWDNIIFEWCEDLELPILVRKGGYRAILGTLPSGRRFVRCDNSPAHWAFMGCCANELPTLDEVRTQLLEGALPLAMARSRTEKALIEAGTHKGYGGFIDKSRYGRVNKFTDGRAYKLCHLQAVGLRSKGEVEDFDEQTLLRHMRLLLSPSNMIVVPLAYSGVGECEAFLEAFRRP